MGYFAKVWDSEGTQSKQQVSVWAPSMETGLLHSNKTRVSLGHYASSGFISPELSKKATKYMLIELTDNSTTRLLKSRTLEAVLTSLFPHPIRMKKVWSLIRGSKSFYAWKAVPPEGFMSLGMFCTTTGIKYPLYLCIYCIIILIVHM